MNSSHSSSKGGEQRQYQRVGIHEEDHDLDLEDEEVHHDLTLQSPSHHHHPESRTFEEDEDEDDPQEEENDEPPPNPFLDTPIHDSNHHDNINHKIDEEDDDYEIDSDDEMELERYAFDFSSQQQKRRQRLHSSSSTNMTDAERGRSYSTHSASDLLQQQQQHQHQHQPQTVGTDESSFGIHVRDLVQTVVKKARSARLESRRKRAERRLEEGTVVPPFNRRFSRYCGGCGGVCYCCDRYWYYYWQTVCGSSWCDLLDGRGVGLLLVMCGICMGLVTWLDRDHLALWLGVGLVPMVLLRVCAWRLVYWILWGRWIEKRRQETMALYDGLNGEHGTGGTQIIVSDEEFEMMEPKALAFDLEEDTLDDNGTENGNDELSYTSHTSMADPPRPTNQYDTTTPTKCHGDPNRPPMELV
eukprot:CAMPEP_0198283496 /NCGR_PEP_ID=MMETSP1449-20131203/3073_1 /TAXON_ID=420275 /ORGANISM="Attheya septentrionalis, Strain CCMP2084" /LENGTH=413 /DNA_ID=CAMNT_0043980123 /DNA_START=164 /DNA_END=1405 /DNA_ORIENTATION=+